MLFFHLNKAVSPATKNTPMQAHECKINRLHAPALLDKHWPSTFHWVSESRFTSAWLNLNWNCEENEIKIAIKSKGIKHGEQSKWERVKSGRVQWQMTEHEATEQRTGVNCFNSRMSATAASLQMQNLNCLTYRFGRSWDVLDHHLSFGAQILLTKRRFAFLVQVHVLLETQAKGRKFQSWKRNADELKLWMNGSLVPELWHFVTCYPCFLLNIRKMCLLSV